MNKQRRKRLISEIDKIQEAVTSLEIIADEEDEAFDNLPEGIQESERGELIAANADQIREVVDELSSLCEQIQEVVNGE